MSSQPWFVPYRAERLAALLWDEAGAHVLALGADARGYGLLIEVECEQGVRVRVGVEVKGTQSISSWMAHHRSAELPRGRVAQHLTAEHRLPLVLMVVDVLSWEARFAWLLPPEIAAAGRELADAGPPTEFAPATPQALSEEVKRISRSCGRNPAVDSRSQ